MLTLNMAQWHIWGLAFLEALCSYRAPRSAGGPGLGSGSEEKEPGDVQEDVRDHGEEDGAAGTALARNWGATLRCQGSLGL